jgi:hypothetical protein
MATERVIDLKHQRYADREYAGLLPSSRALAEQEREDRRRRALLRLRLRAAEVPMVADLLIALGLDE